MALPKIISKLSQKEEADKKEYLLAIEIWDGEVKSAIWTVEGGKTKVAALGSRESWSKKEELVEAADRSLSQASERFTELGQEPSKVIFGLPENWTDGKEIKTEHRGLLKDLYQKLELKPVGYVLTFDALIQQLKRVEGVPPSAILVKLAKDKVYLAVVEVGKKIGVEEIARSQDLASDLREGLARITEVKTLPARILLFDSEDMESANQILIAHPWLKPQPNGKKLAFLHLPKIEILPTDSDINAVALAGGSEVAKSLGFDIKEETPPEEEEATAAEEETTERAEEVVEAGEEISTEELPTEADFGFIKGRDIRDIKEAMPPPPEVTEKGVAEEEQIEPRFKEEPEIRKGRFGLVNSILFPLANFWRRLPFDKILGKIHFPFPLGWPIIAALIGGGILILGGLLFVFLWYLPQAEVTVFVEPKTLEKDFSLTIDPNQEIIDSENRILPGRVLETEEEGEKSADTTGEKTVGEKAKGEVIIYNRTDDEKTFQEGTLVVGSGSLQFTLDEEVRVASKTPDLDTGVDKWGEVKVGVTAEEIGAQYNLAGGTQFSVADYPTSSFLAKNESDLSGGTSRKIQAVSEEDQEDLSTTLSEELADKAEGGLLGKVPPDLSLIEESVITEPVSESFSHEVGEETQTLNLKLTVKIKALAFNREEFVKLVTELLSDSIPEHYKLKEDEIQSRFEVEKENEDGSFLFQTHIKANLLPELQPEEIASHIKGKYQNLAEDYFKTIPGYVRAEINLSPSLPGFLRTLPRRENRIKVEVKSQ